MSPPASSSSASLSRSFGAKQRGRDNMASNTAHDTAAAQGLSEDEPLLGRAGDASQQESGPMYYNLVLGTAVIAQAGIWILAGIVWGSVLSKPIILFSAHPLLNSAGILLTTEAILLLQPTHTTAQKQTGAVWHSVLNGVGVFALIAGLIVIFYNKAAHHGTHFESTHARLGLITYIIFLVQAIIGFTTFYTPRLYGSVSNAKSLYKYHRQGGYLVLLLSFATVAAATQTPWNNSPNGAHIRLWAVLVTALIILMGVLPRVRKHKLGL